MMESTNQRITLVLIRWCFVETIKGIKGIMDPFSFLLSSATWFQVGYLENPHLLQQKTQLLQHPKNMVSLDFGLGPPKKKKTQA